MIAEVQKTIAEAKDEIRRRYRAEIKGIFGSYARGDFHADSDLDLLVDFDEGADLFDLVGRYPTVFGGEVRDREGWKGGRDKTGRMEG